MSISKLCFFLVALGVALGKSIQPKQLIAINAFEQLEKALDTEPTNILTRLIDNALININNYITENVKPVRLNSLAIEFMQEGVSRWIHADNGTMSGSNIVHRKGDVKVSTTQNATFLISVPLELLNLTFNYDYLVQDGATGKLVGSVSGTRFIIDVDIDFETKRVNFSNLLFQTIGKFPVEFEGSITSSQKNRLISFLKFSLENFITRMINEAMDVIIEYLNVSLLQ